MTMLKQSKIPAILTCRIKITGAPIVLRFPNQEPLYGKAIRGEEDVQFEDLLLPEHFDPTSENLQKDELRVVADRHVRYFINQVTTFETWNVPGFAYEIQNLQARPKEPIAP